MNLKSVQKLGKLPYESDISIQFFESHLAMQTQSGTETLNYTAIEKVLANADALYLYKNAMAAYIVPGKVFINIEEKDAFLQWIIAKTSARLIQG